MEKSFDQKWGSKILIGVCLLVAAATYLQSASAKDEPSLMEIFTEEISESVYKESGLSQAPTWKTVFKKGKKNGRHMYLMVYQNSKKGPIDAAIATTAERFDYKEDDMRDILSGDIYLITDYASMNIEDASFEFLKIKNYYNNELTVEEMRSEFESTSLAQEIFVNGDTSDSGFDLIVDLQTIEYILFHTSNTVGYGGGGGLGFGGGDDDGGIPALEDPNQNESGGSGTGGIYTPDIVFLGDPDQDGDIDNKDVCFEDSKLSNAFSDFLAENEDGNENDEEKDGEGGNGGGDGDLSGDDNIDFELDAPQPGDWGRPDPCNEFFCLEINFVEADDEPEYYETDNCIDCHFTFIVELLKETTSHDLGGGKVTGNMMEDATCKDDGLKVNPSIQVFPIASPVPTPPNDEIISVISEKSIEFIQQIYAEYETKETLEDDPEELAEQAEEAEMSVADENAMIVANIQGDNLSLVEATDLTISLTEEAFRAREEAITEFSFENQLNDITSMYQALSYEMDQMNVYFSSIYDMILALYDGDDAPLPEIQSKEYKDN
ncbi:MAG: hypothetical protein ABII07_04755 [Patescibacteria group bacterium]|nr:hypothetical protein [Patescibacteria group bacterium]